MIYKYQTGEEIQKGDHVLYFGNEPMARDLDNPEEEWYVREFGSGEN
jgi:hypothetical protein